MVDPIELKSEIPKLTDISFLKVAQRLKLIRNCRAKCDIYKVQKLLSKVKIKQVVKELESSNLKQIGWQREMIKDKKMEAKRGWDSGSTEIHEDYIKGFQSEINLTKKNFLNDKKLLIERIHKIKRLNEKYKNINALYLNDKSVFIKTMKKLKEKNINYSEIDKELFNERAIYPKLINALEKNKKDLTERDEKLIKKSLWLYLSYIKTNKLL